MRNRNVGARKLSDPILPSLEPGAEWLDSPMVRQVVDSPAFREIATALACAKYLDMDLGDPAVVHAAIDAGMRRHDESESVPYVKRPRREGLHDPVVYYMGIGDLVKIGTTRNIITRHAILCQPTILAVERGWRREERERHLAFAALKVQGEWFRHDDPLRSYVKAVAEDFPPDLGPSLGEWICELRRSSRC